MALKYPEGLPLAQRDGYAFNPTNNITRTEMQSGRARQRVEFEDAPDRLNLRWFFDALEAALFEAWVKSVSAGWFEIPIVSPIGFETVTARFIEKPQGGELRGRYAWQFSATIEIEEREKLDEDLLLLPDFILNAEIFDYGMNREWSLYVTYKLLTEDGFILTTEDGFALTTE